MNKEKDLQRYVEEAEQAKELIKIPNVRYIDRTETEEIIYGALFKKGTNYKLHEVHPEYGSRYKSLVISNIYKISDVLMQLPYGIVDKQITGIGATTLELKSPRNSIIVEPLKAIAYSKADKVFLYVGSAIGDQKSKTSQRQIINYIKNEDIEYKKILVVADSLPRVIEAIGDVAYENYFLMIDEVDSFQADSTFRSRMEICLDIYKKFRKEKRCLITATMLQFSDPALSDETFLEINYENPIKRKIHLTNTRTLTSTCAFKIAEFYAKYNLQKIVVAYNSVTECRKIIDTLIQRYSVDKNNIKLMCSKSNKKTAEPYYAEIENEKLPGQINFLTSAYFTGIDLSEDFHCISISDGNMPFTLLSDHKLKQIAGRCRGTLLSELIIYSCFNRVADPYEKLDKEALIEVAKVQVNAINCFNNQYKNNLFLKQEVNKLKDAAIESQNFNGLTFVRIDQNDLTKISYFNIDASIERTRIRFDLYNSPNQLKEKLLSQGHQITFENLEKDKVVLDKNYLKDNQEALVGEALKNLNELNIDNLHQLNELQYTCGSPIQERIYTQFGSLISYLDKPVAIEKITELIEKSIVAFRNFKESIVFASLPESNPLKQDYLTAFKIGSSYTLEEIKTKRTQIHNKNHMHDLLNPAGDYGIQTLNLFFDTETIRERKKGNDTRRYKILRLKTFDFPIKKS